MRTSRVGKGQWMKAEGLRCLTSMGRPSRNLRTLPPNLHQVSCRVLCVPSREEEAPLT